MKAQGTRHKTQGRESWRIVHSCALFCISCTLRLVPFMRYFVKTPWWLKMVFPRRIWNMDTRQKSIYLSFDDGPHPVATPFVLDELKKYHAKATFFCIGKNVAAHPEIYNRILEEGHTTGNHTHHHLNGLETKDEIYLGDITEASHYIRSYLFRPPYGRMKASQVKGLSRAMNDPSAKIVMWDVLSGDFDESVSPEKCLDHVTRHSRPGSIVLFHDSEKAFPRVRHALPASLEFFTKKGYDFRGLNK